MREVMNSLESKDWSRLYDFIAYKDSDGSDRPAFSDFRNSITADNVSISDSSVLSSAWPTDGLHNKVFVDFTVATNNTQPTAKSDVSVEVANTSVKFNGIIWRGHTIHFPLPEILNNRGRIVRVSGWYQIDDPVQQDPEEEQP